MANKTTVLETTEVTDLEDGSTLTVVVQSCTELGNEGRPGLQILFMGNIVSFEPRRVERWAYQARKAGKEVLLIDDASWNVHADQFVRNSLVLGDPPKVRVEVKTRSKARPVVKEYALPFQVEE